MYKRFSPCVTLVSAATVLLFALYLCGDWRRADLAAQEAKDPKEPKEAAKPGEVSVTASRVRF